MRMPVLQFMINSLLGAGDSDSVTRRLRHAIARSRSRRTVARTRLILPDLLALLGGRDHPDTVIRDITSSRRRR
ncbi:MAG TPA: hypothetical protein VNA04_05360 [Thermoanaerobaculia bacterium]|nr:hypothetical protein [Thermoanaerobaculia bacterium]